MITEGVVLWLLSQTVVLLGAIAYAIARFVRLEARQEHSEKRNHDRYAAQEEGLSKLETLMMQHIADSKNRGAELDSDMRQIRDLLIELRTKIEVSNGK
jgi:hypothetical protein